MAYRTEMQRPVIKITEYRNGMTWKTKEVGRIWVPIEPELTLEDEAKLAKQHGGDLLGSMPTDTPFEERMRSVKF